MQQVGIVNLSLDAVGQRFDEVRHGGVWTKAQPGLEKFLHRRDPAALSVGIYPTVTRRTVGDALAIMRWADEHDVDEVAFHRYIPIANSFEEAPTTEELRRLSDQLSEWAAAHSNTIKTFARWPFLSRPVGVGGASRIAHPMKHKFRASIAAMMAPMEQEMTVADPVAICAAPDHYVEIGLDGQISACCRAQDVPLGFATSPEAFAKAWFGNNYQRDSRLVATRCERLPSRYRIARAASRHSPLKACAGAGPSITRCRRGTRMGSHASITATGRSGAIEAVQKEQGYCHIAMMSPGMMLSEYEVFEGEHPLGPAASLHDDIRQHGRGRYSMWGRAVYFSTSDNSDARYNGRRYSLKRRPA